MLHRSMENPACSMFMVVLFVGVPEFVCSLFLSCHGSIGALCQRKIDNWIYIGPIGLKIIHCTRAMRADPWNDDRCLR